MLAADQDRQWTSLKDPKIPQVSSRTSPGLFPATMKSHIVDDEETPF